MAKAAIFLVFSWLAQYGSAKEVHLDWNVTWVNAAPNGHQRPVIGINGEWPCPQIDLDLGDRLIVDLYNGLGNQSTGLHWHGFRQYMTGTMDGASDVTQCPLAPGSKMTYDFTVSLYLRVKQSEYTLITARSTKLGRTGTIPTTWVSIPTAYGVP